MDRRQGRHRTVGQRPRPWQTWVPPSQCSWTLDGTSDPGSLRVIVFSAQKEKLGLELGQRGDWEGRMGV